MCLLSLSTAFSLRNTPHGCILLSARKDLRAFAHHRFGCGVLFCVCMCVCACVCLHSPPTKHSHITFTPFIGLPILWFFLSPPTLPATPSKCIRAHPPRRLGCEFSQGAHKTHPQNDGFSANGVGSVEFLEAAPLFTKVNENRPQDTVGAKGCCVCTVVDFVECVSCVPFLLPLGRNKRCVGFLTPTPPRMLLPTWPPSSTSSPGEDSIN